MRDQLRMAEAARIAAVVPDKSGVDHYAEWHRKLSHLTGPGE